MERIFRRWMIWMERSCPRIERKKSRRILIQRLSILLIFGIRIKKIFLESIGLFSKGVDNLDQFFLINLNVSIVNHALWGTCWWNKTAIHFLTKKVFFICGMCCACREPKRNVKRQKEFTAFVREKMHTIQDFCLASRKG